MMLVENFINGYSIRFSKNVKDQFTDDEFYEFCRMNNTLKFERDQDGNILIMALTGGKTGKRNMALSANLYNWNEKTKLGQTFDSSTGFKLPNTSVRSPDAAWISNEKWNALSETEKEKFPPLCPEFIIELMSATDEITHAFVKMNEYMENGCELAWLIYPTEKKTFIYRKGENQEIIEGFDKKLSGENILKGFEFDLKEIVLE